MNELIFNLRRYYDLHIAFIKIAKYRKRLLVIKDEHNIFLKIVKVYLTWYKMVGHCRPLIPYTIPLQLQPRAYLSTNYNVIPLTITTQSQYTYGGKLTSSLTGNGHKSGYLLARYTYMQEWYISSFRSLPLANPCSHQFK